MLEQHMAFQCLCWTRNADSPVPTSPLRHADPIPFTGHPCSALHCTALHSTAQHSPCQAHSCPPLAHSCPPLTSSKGLSLPEGYKSSPTSTALKAAGETLLSGGQFHVGLAFFFFINQLVMDRRAGDGGV